MKPQINYPADQYPDGVPEFKSFPKEVISKMFFQYNEEEMRFKTISEFKSSLLRGGEIVIEWNKQLYGFFYNGTAFYITFPDGEKSYYVKCWNDILVTTGCVTLLHRQPFWTEHCNRWTGQPQEMVFQTLVNQ